MKTLEADPIINLLTPLILSTGESRLELVRKPVENEQAFTWRRIVYKLDLNSIYPGKSPAVLFNASVAKLTPLKSLKQPVSFLLDHDKLYFLTNANRPATLRVNVYLNSTLNPKAHLQKYTKVYDVQQDKVQKTHVFEMKAAGSLEDVLNSEKAILSEFETKLWKSAKPCKDCLSIAYIREDSGQYRIGVASSQKHSDLLDEFCFLRGIPGEYLKITNLDVNRRFAQCKTIKAVHQTKPERYVVNVFVNITTKPLGTDRSWWKNVANLFDPWTGRNTYQISDEIGGDAD